MHNAELHNKINLNYASRKLKVAKIGAEGKP